MDTRRLRALWGPALGVWAAGVQLNEALATAGALATVALALVDAAGGGALAPPRAVLKAWWPLAAFLGWSLLAPLLAGRPPTGSGAARLFDWLGVPAAAWLVARAPSSTLRRVGVAAAAVLLVSCAAAGLQHFGVWPDRAALRPLEVLRLPLDRVYEPAPGQDGRFLAGGLLFHRLRFAHVTMLAATVALAVALRGRGRVRAVAGTCAAVALVSVALFPGARAAFVAGLAACALQLALGAGSVRRALAWLGVLVALGGALLALSPALRTRLAAAASTEGSGDRAGLAAGGLAAAGAHPLVGLGAGRFRVSEWAPESATQAAREHGGKAHNQFLTVAAEGGAVALLLFLALLAWLGAHLAWGGAWGRAALGPLALLVLLFTLHDALFHAEVSLAAVLALGAGLGAARRAEEEPQGAARTGDSLR